VHFIKLFCKNTHTCSFLTIFSVATRLYCPVLSTYYARISCGRRYGVSKNCKFCDVRVLPANKNYKRNDVYKAVIQGLQHVISHCKNPKVKCVANMSIDINHGPEQNKQVKKKIEQAWDAGISVVALAPAGKHTCKDAYGSSPKVISVGHVKQWDKKQGAYGNCVTVYGSATMRDNAVGRKFYCHCCKNHYYALGVFVVMISIRLLL
jgi:hypothetical protein